MSPQEANKNIFSILSKLPYASVINLKPLDSDEKIIAFINKAIEGVYSQISSDPQLRDQIDKETVTNVLASHFVNQINATRTTYEKFDYQTMSGFSAALNISNLIKEASTKVIEPEVTTLKREDAEVFLKHYENKIESFKQQIALMEKSPNKKMTKTIEAKKKELEKYQTAIEKIKSEEPSITILFPPFSSPRELSKQQIDTIRKMEPSEENKAITEISKYIQLSNLALKQFEHLAQTINPQYYDIEKIGRIISNLNNDFLGKEASKLYLAALTEKLVSKIDMKNLAFPLSKENANTIESLINFKKYIDENKERISISPETEELLHAQDINKLEGLLEDTHKVERYNRLHDKASSAPSSVSKHLTQQEHSFLSLFDKIITHGNYSTSTERNELSLMLEKCIGNMDFNKKLDLFNKENKPLSSTYKYTILDIKYFGFKAKSPPGTNIAILDKCEKAIMQIEAGAVLSSKNQINLYELGRLEDLAKLKEKMDKYNELELIKSSSKLSKLYEQVNRAAAIFEKIEEQQLSEKAYKSGDILMAHSKKSLTVKNKSADNETALTHTFISKYGHAAQIYIDPETEKPKLSHIYGGYQSDDVKAVGVVISEVFRVDPIKLIPTDMQRKLDAYYTEQSLDYKVEVRKLFEHNIQNLHASNQERFANILNNKSARFQAGLAKFGLYGGHTSNKSNDFGEVHKEMYGTDEKLTIRNKMICSEFVARSLIAALYETNKHLKKKLGTKATSVIRVPLEKEHLSRLPPERLIDLLQKEGCLEQVSCLPFLKKLVNHDDLTRKTDVSVKKPCQIFYEELVILAKTHEHDTPAFKIEATKAFNRYAEREKLDLDLDSPKMTNFLDNSFSKMHSKINEKPNIIIQFFKALKNFLGYKAEAQQTVEKTICDLEKLQVDLIKHRYVDKPTQNTVKSSIATTSSLREQMALGDAGQTHECSKNAI